MITVQINLQFTVTVCEADSTTCTESDSTVCYDESDSDNDSLSSQPMFIEDTEDTDNELPHREVAEVKGPGPVVPMVAAGAPSALDPDCNKCKCAEDVLVY